MKNIKNKAIKNDVVYTPDWLAQKIVEHFKPTGKILEPCCGDGAFLKYLKNAEWYEITKGKDFFDCEKHYDWIITNPPWSIFRQFLIHSLSVADNIVFLIPIPHYFFKARMREIYNNDFGICEIIAIDTPKSFPQMGLQLGIVYIKKGFDEGTKIIYDKNKNFTQQRLSAEPTDIASNVR